MVEHSAALSAKFNLLHEACKTQRGSKIAHDAAKRENSHESSDICQKQRVPKQQ